MQIKLGKKKLVMFVANADDVLDDDIIRLLKGKTPSWTEREYQEAAELLKQFGLQVLEPVIRSIKGEIDTFESQEKVREGFDQWRIKFESFTRRKEIP